MHKIMDRFKLEEKAIEGSKKAYAPYSNFFVGAALLTSNDKVYTGGNIENISYGGTICAERVALFQALMQGEKNFTHLFVHSTTHAWPCGLCRQTLSEFFSKESLIMIRDKDQKIKGLTMNELYPLAFDKNCSLNPS